jgi:hypothetical protein
MGARSHDVQGAELPRAATRSGAVPQTPAHGNGLDTVSGVRSRTDGRTLSFRAALGYVEDEHRADYGDARTYLRNTGRAR